MWSVFRTSYSVTKDIKYLFWFVQQPITSHQKCYKLNQNNLILYWGSNVPSDNVLWSKRNHEMMRSLWHLWSSKDGFTESVENKSAGVLSVRANISTLKYQHTTALATTACMLHYKQTSKFMKHGSIVDYIIYLYSFAEYHYSDSATCFTSSVISYNI